MIRRIHVVLATLTLAVMSAGIIVAQRAMDGSPSRAGSDCLSTVEEFREYPIFFVGEEFEGLPLVACKRYQDPGRVVNGVVQIPPTDSFDFIYGVCTIPKGSSSCSVPMSIYVYPPCDRERRLHDELKSNPFEVRGASGFAVSSQSIVVEVEGSPVKIYGPGAGSERLQAAVRVAENLVGANDMAAHVTKASSFDSPPPDTATAYCEKRDGGHPAIAVDADRSQPGIQETRTITTDEDFVIALEASGASRAFGYAWELQWNDRTLDFVDASENTAVTGATLCVPASPNPSAPPGEEWQGAGAGCVRSSGVLPETAVLTTITLRCNVTDGTTTEIRLVPVSEDPDFGTTFLLAGGGRLPLETKAAAITCGR
jgi:hypothetical protein